MEPTFTKNIKKLGSIAKGWFQKYTESLLPPLDKSNVLAQVGDFPMRAKP